MTTTKSIAGNNSNTSTAKTTSNNFDDFDKVGNIDDDW